MGGRKKKITCGKGENFRQGGEGIRRPSHMHTISCAQQQKVAVIAVLPLHSEAKV
jgi:hypothetical protein